MFIVDDIIQNDDVCVVELTALSDYGRPLASVTASSRREPTDKNDRDLAQALAFGRAYRQLGRQLLKDAQRTVRLNDLQKQKQVAATQRAIEERQKAIKKARKAAMKAHPSHV